MGKDGNRVDDNGAGRNLREQKGDSKLENLEAESFTILAYRKYAKEIAASRVNIKVRKKSTVYGI